MTCGITIRRGDIRTPRRSRKNEVTLMRIALNNCVNSSGSTSRWSLYDVYESTPTADIRFSIRLVNVARLYAVKSKPRVSLR